jgi:putative DNA primase/helicase
MREGPGVLNWLLEGARNRGDEGLQTPNIVTSATDEYRAEMDVIGNFIRERCVKGEGCSFRERELFKCYQGRCEENNEYAYSERFFGQKL